MFRLGIPAPTRRRRLSVPDVLLVLASGCATGFGPKAVRSERSYYDRQIIRSIFRLESASAQGKAPLLTLPSANEGAQQIDVLDRTGLAKGR